MGLAAATDYTLAHDSASVKLSELAVGIGPFVVGPAVERKLVRLLLCIYPSMLLRGKMPLGKRKRTLQ